jgi:hypothetical protein
MKGQGHKSYKIPGIFGQFRTFLAKKRTFSDKNGHFRFFMKNLSGFRG